jgi:hypothetical protein
VERVLSSCQKYACDAGHHAGQKQLSTRHREFGWPDFDHATTCPGFSLAAIGSIEGKCAGF